MAYTKRADGRYQTKIYIGTTDGKQQYKYLYAKSSNELKQKEVEYRRLHNIGVDLLVAEDSFFEWFEKLKIVNEIKLSHREYQTWIARVNYFLSYVGDMQLKKIKKSHLEPIIIELFKENPSTGNPTAKRTLEKYIKACSNVFEYAIEDQAIEFNPCRNLKAPKQAKVEERRVLTEEEQQWVREYDHRAKLPAMIMLYSGLRKGELSALKWEDIDLKAHTITVNKSYSLKENRTKTPKTQSGNRVVSIPQILVDYLNTVKKETGYVVTGNDGKMMSEHSWRNLWISYMTGLDNRYGSKEKRKKVFNGRRIYTIELFTPHCLRHTFCSLMYNAGVDVLTCKQQMGHSDIKTTLAIYTHLDELNKKNNISKLDELLQGVSKQVSKIG